jgi:hypothetical protein
MFFATIIMIRMHHRNCSEKDFVVLDLDDRLNLCGDLCEGATDGERFSMSAVGGTRI